MDRAGGTTHDVDGGWDHHVDVDVVVIGAGIAGLTTAALLAHAGKRVLVVEREDRVGGRGSTEEIDGFLINTGAVGIELGGPMEEVFRTVGAPYDVRVPPGGAALRIKGRTLRTDNLLGRFLLDGVLRRGGALLSRRWRTEMSGDAPEPTFAEWLSRYTSNATVHQLCRNLSAGFYAVNHDELPARVMFHYLIDKSGFRRFGFGPYGTIGPMRDLARAIERDGGEVWLSAPATDLDVEDGRVTGVAVCRGGEEVRVSCDQVVCSAGPDLAIALVGEDAFPEAYVELVRERVVAAPMFNIHIASRKPLFEDAGLVFFGDTTRLCALAHITSVCPESAPEGWELYQAFAVPTPALGDYDEEAELAITMEELRRELDGFDDARVIAAPIRWAQLVRAGQELDSATPIPNLWNVGDSTRAYADLGLQASAANGQEVARRVLRAGLLASRPAATPVATTVTS